jgi:putative ABC transport system permease protein
MGLLSIFRQMLRDVREQKLRTLLTLFGITWGTIAVALLVAFGEGLQRQNLKNIHMMGDQIVLAWPGHTTLAFQGLPKGRAVRVVEEDVEALRHEIPEARFAGVYSGGVTPLVARRGAVRLAPQIEGTSPDLGPLRNLFPQVGGRFINSLDVQERRRVVFLGNKIAVDLFGDLPPIGQTLTIGDLPFVVVGVLERKAQEGGNGNPDGDSIWMASSTFIALTNQLRVSNLVFKADRPSDTPRVIRRVYEVLGARHQFDPDDRQSMGLWDTSEGDRFMYVFFGSLRAFLGIVGACTLIVGGIGVSNIMYVVLEERTREIGIKMAVGAKPRYIQMQFLLETVLLTALGGLLGFAITLALLAVFPSFGLEPYVGRPEASPVVLVSTTALLGIVGVVAGYFPARRASRLDPVVALKLS